MAREHATDAGSAPPSRSREEEQANASGVLVAGVDEAGRGPLAGPLAVAAVILDPACPIPGLNDSKKLSEAKREALYPLIVERAVAYSIVLIEPDEIDRLNIFQATMTGMRRAVAGLAPLAHEVLVDGNQLPQGLPCPGRAIVGGDALEPAISAASILAKVSRDHVMVALDSMHPGYGFAMHKGYPTPAHLTALQRLGPCAQHRRSFAPVRLLLDQARLF
ncbi:MAG: ribonuclease HII [Rhodanobacter sp.]|jgi:ribonuclease HII|uniref:ribonuclease HII n=1 Tax=Rhodanobacter sp. KK11 TaxID=3083255 RepID=UPI00296627AF|nr:ribonuclease HII [Rhodanobacter sp. KK11]MDW2980709.1 ribonuclease HII [Rhodanobacter sp. KK11]